jgi:hypothetical protein
MRERERWREMKVMRKTIFERQREREGGRDNNEGN